MHVGGVVSRSPHGGGGAVLIRVFLLLTLKVLGLLLLLLLLRWVCKSQSLFAGNVLVSFPVKGQGRCLFVASPCEEGIRVRERTGCCSCC